MARAIAAFALAVGIGLGTVVVRGLPGQSSSSPTATQAPAKVSPADYDLLTRRDLAIPVPGVNPKSILDTFNETRGGSRRHEATDIFALAGTRVIAVDDGTVNKLFWSLRGGLTVYQFDSTEIYCYYYAHLQRYAQRLHEGQAVKRGDLLGYVGTTGDARANGPHLHFAIFKLGPEKQWWEGTPINPYPILTEARPH
jgi:peptidoglycan LD-endopeptidase LytH